MKIKNAKKDSNRKLVAVNAIMTFGKKLVRNDTLQDKPYLVVPMVMMVEGVHSGSEGPYLYTNEELGKRVELWNRKPVVVYHPDGITACTKDILNTRGIGDIMNAKWDKKGKRLLAEAWLDEERVKKVDGRILEAIENEETLELSTGLFADSDEVSGEWNGEEYQGTLTNFGPDHLAILPDQIGACSVEDGAGFYRNSEGEKIILSKMEMKHLNELSHNTIRDLLSKAIVVEGEYRYVEDVKDKTFIWSSDNGYWEQEYTVKKDKVETKGVAVAVQRVIEYKPVTNKDGKQNNVKKERVSEMNKNELVNALITNEGLQWEEDDREYLMNLDEERLQSMQPKPKKNESKKSDSKPPEKKEEAPAEPVTPQNAEPKAQTPPTEEEYKAQMPPAIRNRMERLERMENQEVERLVGIITKNPKNTFTEEWLKTQDIEMLQNLVNIASTESTEEQPNIVRFNYGLGGNPHQEQKKDNSDVPVLNAPGDVKPKSKTA